MSFLQPPHQHSAAGEQWVCAHGQARLHSEKSQHHDSSGRLQHELGQDAHSPHTGCVRAARKMKVRQNQLQSCYANDWHNAEIKMQGKIQFPPGPLLLIFYNDLSIIRIWSIAFRIQYGTGDSGTKDNNLRQAEIFWMHSDFCLS